MTDAHHARDPVSVPCAVVTISDTRTETTDASGKIIKELLTAAGHEVRAYTIIPDEPHQIRLYLQRLAEGGTCLAALLSGGTGLAPRDTTVEAVSELFSKPISGFGELFRFLSFQEIGAKAMLSRAVAGAYKRMIIYAMPGAPAAVELAVSKLILPTLAHTVSLIRNE